MTADLHECNGVVEGHGVESGEVEVGEIRKTTSVEENSKSSEDKVSCNGDSREVCDEEVDDDDNLSEGEHSELKLENGEVKSSDQVSEHVAEEIESQRSESEDNGHDPESLKREEKIVDDDVVENGITAQREKKFFDDDVVENGITAIDTKSLIEEDVKFEVHDSMNEHEKDSELQCLTREKKIFDDDLVENGITAIDAKSLIEEDVKVEVHDSTNEHERDSELQCLTNGDNGTETESAKDEEQESVSQVVGDVDVVVEPKSVKNKDTIHNFEEIVEDNNIGLSDQFDEAEVKEYAQEDGGNQSDKAESKNVFSEEHKLELSEALPVLDRNCELDKMTTQTLIEEDSQHDSETMKEKFKSLESKDIAPDFVINEVNDRKPQFVLNEAKGPEVSAEDKSIALDLHSVVIEESKSELQCMPNGSIELASHLDVTVDKELESGSETHDDKGFESYRETPDDKVEEVSNGKDEASEQEIASINDSVIDGASDKSGETSGPRNGTEQSVLLENIADGADWVSTGDPVLSVEPVPQISSNEPKHESDVPKKTFYCLVKIPRHIDNKIKAQIRLAELQLNEKTKTREFIRAALTMKRSSKDQILDSLKAARQEEREIREAIKAKRVEMEPVQSALNKLKNSNSAVEYDEKINQMEYRIAHESIPLTEEKQLLREIKQLKASRNELCASAGPHSELQEAFNHIDKIQDRSKLLGQDLETLKKQQFQAEKSRQVIEKEFNELNDALRQLQIQWNAANVVRQEAYEALRDLKKQDYERNHEFYTNRTDIQAAKQYALAGDREALEKLCSNQVERIIEMWNRNAEFRKEYAKDNERSTLRRLETFDGRSLGPDEEPPLPTNYAEDINTSLLNQGKPSPSGIRPVRENKSTTTVERSDEVEPKPKGLQSPSKEMAVLAKKSAGHQSVSKEVTDHPKKSDGKSKKSGLITNIESFEINSDIVKNEEEELAKKEEAAKMKEAHRLEEKKKAKEADERKRKLAERANAKALARAQKEAERKEKDRQKRANKKAAAAATAFNTTENDSASSEMQNDASRDSKLSSISEARELGSTSQKPTSSQRKKQASQKVKPVFPAVKKGKKGVQTWMWILLAVVLCLFLLVLWFRF